MITYFKHKNNKSKNKYEKHKTSNTKIKSFDTFITIATTSSSITLSLTAIGLIAIPILIVTACGLSVGYKVKYEKILNRYNKYRNNLKKINEKLSLSTNYTEKLYKAMSSIKMDSKVYAIISKNLLMKKNLFNNYKHKSKTSFSVIIN